MINLNIKYIIWALLKKTPQGDKLSSLSDNLSSVAINENVDILFNKSWLTQITVFIMFFKSDTFWYVGFPLSTHFNTYCFLYTTLSKEWEREIRPH